MERIGLCGSGIDSRITVFFNPGNRSIAKAVIEDLDKAAVEMVSILYLIKYIYLKTCLKVWVSAKREDADRKLGIRINNEMKVGHILNQYCNLY